MGYEETVMSDRDSEDLMNRNSAHPIKTQVRIVKEAQAEISFKVGIREVVETAFRKYYNEENRCWTPGIFDYLHECRAKLEERGIDGY